MGSSTGTGRTRKLNRATGAIFIIPMIGLALLVWKGCQGLPANVANCPITPTAPANITVLPPAVEPPPSALCAFPLTVSVPADGATVNSPATVTAKASAPDPLYWMRVYVDGSAVYYSFTPDINQYIWMSPGPHTIEVAAEDVAGYIATATTHVNVGGLTPGISSIQNLPDWQSCSSVLATGLTCAAGLGTATSELIHAQSSPSLDGSAAEFTMGGPHPYSNELYWAPLGGGNSVSHFTYDLWFYVDHGDAPQSLEFDVNQAFGGTRWTWGTQCDFNQAHRWDIWDPLHGVWVPTNVPCDHFPSATWIHLIWTFERVGNQVHYITLSVDGQESNIDTYYTAQPNWYQEEIDVAFQLDGNYKQEPYTVSLDEVTLNAY
jgi:hypothetical protein